MTFVTLYLSPLQRTVVKKICQRNRCSKTTQTVDSSFAVKYYRIEIFMCPTIATAPLPRRNSPPPPEMKFLAVRAP